MEKGASKAMENDVFNWIKSGKIDQDTFYWIYAAAVDFENATTRRK